MTMDCSAAIVIFVRVENVEGSTDHLPKSLRTNRVFMELQISYKCLKALILERDLSEGRIENVQSCMKCLVIRNMDSI